jgi:hypothetical protein
LVLLLLLLLALLELFSLTDAGVVIAGSLSSGLGGAAAEAASFVDSGLSFGVSMGFVVAADAGWSCCLLGSGWSCPTSVSTMPRASSDSSVASIVSSSAKLRKLLVRGSVNSFLSRDCRAPAAVPVAVVTLVTWELTDIAAAWDDAGV